MDRVISFLQKAKRVLQIAVGWIQAAVNLIDMLLAYLAGYGKNSVRHYDL